MKQGLLYFTDTYLTVIGLLIFFGFFLSVIWWTSLPRNKNRFRRFENLPFENGENHES